MSTASSRTATVVVVDPNHEDYADLLAAASAANVHVHIRSSASDALHLARQCRAGLWLINTQLPDMSGLELAQVLLHKRFNARVFMVGDDYDVQEELETLASGLAMYLCKPLSGAWISQWDLRQLASLRNDEPRILSAFPAESEGAAATVSAHGRGQQITEVLVPESDEQPTILPFPRRGRRRPAA